MINPVDIPHWVADDLAVAIRAAIALGHDMEPDPGWRWSCRHSDCGRAVLKPYGVVYGSAAERPCRHQRTFAGRVELAGGGSKDDRFGWIGDAHSGTLFCQWPGCGAQIFTDTHRSDAAADEHWRNHS